MADNRMWLINDVTGARVLLARHTQSAWCPPADVLVKLGAAFDDELIVDNRPDAPMPWRGTCRWRLEYERQQDDV